jgi:hypothetical protein
LVFELPNSGGTPLPRLSALGLKLRATCKAIRQAIFFPSFWAERRIQNDNRRRTTGWILRGAADELPWFVILNEVKDPS